jgi:thiol-disulfide isomerase/thioredoxin
MLNIRKPWLTAFHFVLGYSVLSGVNAGAGEKKQEDKKNVVLASKYVGKAIELKLTDGKANYPAELNEKDPKAFDRYYKVFSVELEKGKTYRIDQRHRGDPQFDSYLFLEDADGAQLDADDESGGGLNARIVYKIAKTSTYRIIATTLPKDQTGKFVLEIGAPSPEDAKVADFRYRIDLFAGLSGAERKDLVEEVRKHIVDQEGDLTLNDARIAFQLAGEAEIGGDVGLARDLYKHYIKYFSAASKAQVTAVTEQFELSLKGVDKLGKVIEITGTTVAGKDFDLKDLKGKVVLIDFWGTWCAPCVAEIPNIVKAYEKYHGKDFDVIGVSSDKEDGAVVGFLKANKIPWPCINIADSRKLIDMHGVTGYPTTMLVDQAGRIVSMHARGPQLDRLLERLLRQKK